MANWQNRIVGEGVKPASQFLANPDNWRLHPQHQRDAVRGSLDELGWIQRVIENKRTGRLIDGHERIWQALQNDDAEVPYVQVDLSEDEERMALATLDPLSALAETDYDKLRELTANMTARAPGLQQMLENMRTSHLHLAPPSTSELDAKYGNADDRAFWPVLKLQIPPDVFNAYKEAIAEIEGGEEHERFAILVNRAREA